MTKERALHIYSYRLEGQRFRDPRPLPAVPSGRWTATFSTVPHDEYIEFVDLHFDGRTLESVSGAPRLCRRQGLIAHLAETALSLPTDDHYIEDWWSLD